MVETHPGEGDGPPAQTATDSHTSVSATTRAGHLLALPSECIASILSHVTPTDLSRVSGTCRALHILANDDHLWQAHVQQNVPGQTVTSSHPFASFRDLFCAHHPRWFVPKYKIWFADATLTGRLIVARYDQRRGCIEAYDLLATNKAFTQDLYEWQPGITVSPFDPEIKLHLDRSCIRLPAYLPDHVPHDNGTTSTFIPHEEGGDTDGEESPSPSSSARRSQGQHVQKGNAFQPEIIIPPDPLTQIRKKFQHARCLSPEDMTALHTTVFPYLRVWPPPTIPASRRILGAVSGVQDANLRPEDIATSRHEVYDRGFRISTWVERAIGPESIHSAVETRHELYRGLIRRINIGEATATYSTLDPELYTPTPSKPFRGIWVGDYSAHGCEFVWIHQPDDDPDDPFDPANIVRLEGETDEAYAARKRDATIYRGKLEAVKLTGDANVPRGEYTFIVDDLGEGGFVGFAQGAPFGGVRTVRSKGHIARNGFRYHEYIDAQLMLISPNELAHHWIMLGHVSYLHRVDIDQFVVPDYEI